MQDIFRWKLDGMSQQGIADLLNVDGVLCPAKYKRSLGMKCVSGFKHNSQSKWSAAAVGRIPQNPLYIGVMVQGKTGCPNYKIKKLTDKLREERISVMGAHEAIIVEKTLEFVAALLAEDMAVKRIDR